MATALKSLINLSYWMKITNGSAPHARIMCRQLRPCRFIRLHWCSLSLSNVSNTANLAMLAMVMDTLVVEENLTPMSTSPSKA